ncbi:MAG: GTP-binding protein, partial [Bdellovibrionales bacterium]|nr:GTP-binding protein [Bdellovibrionales bacterium]
LAISEFHEFGLSLIPASFEQDFGIDRIVEWIMTFSKSVEEVVEDLIRISVVGKPNAGKSSLCNFLLGEKRMLVSPVAGTTADAVEATFEAQGQRFLLTDTAGLRRAAKRKEALEQISAIKSEQALRKADIVLLVVDMFEGVSHQDSRLVENCLDEHKAIILVANKIDLNSDERAEAKAYFRQQLERELHYSPDIPCVFISAKTGYGVNHLIKEVLRIHEKLHARISTSQLNQFFTEVIRKAPAPVWGTKDVKFYYLTQTHQTPPSFIAFANHPQGITPAYRRFITKNLQEAFDLKGVPIRLFALPSKSKSRLQRGAKKTEEDFG